ncbi:MAG: serine/threonine protein kinase [Deltaproteobacteria bacterium]|nr:serine/threonine protein kinase [Deltaproteobacteria bacterium]
MEPTSGPPTKPADGRDAGATWDAAPAVGGAPSGTHPTEGVTPMRTAGSRGDAVAQAMRDREAAAMRSFVWLVYGVVGACFVSLPLLAASATDRLALGACALVSLIGAFVTQRRLRRGPLGVARTALFGATCIIGGSAGIWFFGFYSAAPVITSLGVFFFGMQRSRLIALGFYLWTALSHGIAMLAMTFGWIEDHGVVSSAGLGERNQLVMIGLVEAVFGLVFLLARAVKRAIEDAAIQLERTTREVAAREALLDEARRELERALEVGGPGRFTEQRLGPWQLGVLCGRGAMGDVYEATRVGSGERAAIKLLTREGLGDKGQLRRFLRESRVASSIDAPNVVRVIDVAGEDAPVPYLAMELLRGKDLSAILRRSPRLAVADALALLDEIGRGLDALHAAGIVHRDLKPQNLFRADAPAVWKILDFGVSRVVDVDSSLTRGQAIGTPAYMAPEQARGQEVDHRADLFGLGAIAYRVLTGRPAFGGVEVPHILYSVVHAMPPRPSTVAALPRAIDDVLAVALAKRPGDRFASAGELARAVSRAMGGEVDPELAERAQRLAIRWPWAQGSRGERPEA